MIEIKGARPLVLAHGTPRQVARLHALLDSAPAPREVAGELESLQSEDGGFSVHPGGPASVQATCRVLGELRTLPPLAGSPMASRALSFLRRRQRQDGSWSEADGVPNADLTAEALYTLALMASDHPQPARLAAVWLGDRPVSPLAEVYRAAAHYLLSIPVPPPALGEGPDLARALAVCTEARVGGMWQRTVADGLGALTAGPATEGHGAPTTGTAADVETLLLTLQSLRNSGYLTS